MFPGTSSAGFDFELDDNTHGGPRSLTFHIDADGINLPDAATSRRFVPYNVADGSFHTFQMTSDASAHTFSFLIDGQKLADGTEEVFDFGNKFFFR